jgi:phenylacetate-CoA ligase
MNWYHFKGIVNLYVIDILRGTHIYNGLKKLRKEQFFSDEALYHKSKLAYQELLQLAHQHTTYYQNMSTEKPIPVLTKELIKKNHKDLVNKAYKGDLSSKATGGSSGNPLVYVTTKEAQSFMWAGIILSWEVAGYILGDRIAFVAGTSLSKSDFKHRVFHSLLNIKTYSAYDLTDNRIAEYLDDIRATEVQIIYAYASALDLIADYMIRVGYPRIPSLKSIVSTAEILRISSRKKIESAFKVRVYNQYGCNEAGISAFECENGNLHLINSGSWTYTDADDNLMATNLVNKGFLMINYFTGDKIIFSKNSTCSCGRGYPIIEEVIGRTFECITDRNGKLLHAAFFSILFRNDDTIERYQVQYDTESIHLLLKVKFTQVNNSHYEQYIHKVKQYLSFKHYDLQLNVPFYSAINGKHLQVVDLTKIHHENLV